MLTHLLQWTLSNTLVAAALGLLALIVGRFARRPAVTHALWVLVLIKLFTPSLFSAPMGPRIPMTAPVAPTNVQGVAASTSRTEFPAPTSLHPESLLEQFSDIDQTHWPARHVALQSKLTAMAAVIWFVGSLICASIAVFRIRRFIGVLRHGSAALTAHQCECDQAARKLSLQNSPTLWMLPGRITPMLWAPMFSPHVLLPAELWKNLTRDQRQTLLLHELAHLKRRDHWARWVELMATVVFWWNPLAWWARSQLRQAEEECCDAWVTWAQPGAGDDYSAALLEVIDFTSQKIVWYSQKFNSSMPALATGVSRFRHLSRRLKMIDRGMNHHRLGLAGVACICAAMAMLPVAMAPRGQAAAAKAPEQPDPQADRRVKSVDKGLEWLAAHLPLPSDKAGVTETDATHRTAIVSLCGMTFLASGSDLQQGPYHVPLAQCVDAVLGDCHDDGLIASAKASAVMYHHGYATLFLAEVYARTGDARLKPRLEKAVALIEKSQSPKGAWRYTSEPIDGDVSVTACVLNGLLAAKAAKIEVKPATLKRAIDYVLACKNPDGGYIYVAGSSSFSGPARTAAAAAVLQHAGGQGESVRSAVNFLKPFAANKNPMAHESYLDYYASQFIASAADEASREMYRDMSDLILSRQNDDGSWDSHSFSKCYDTACAILALQARDARLCIFVGGK